MKKLISSFIALCMLLAICMPSFAEDYAAVIENQFKWGISASEYISAYNISEYETSYNGNLTAISIYNPFNDGEDAYFINDQFVLSVTYYYYADENKVQEMKGELEGLFGYYTAGGAERLYNLLNAMVPGAYSSPDEFGECFYAELPENGYVGFICNYFDEPGVGDHYWVFIANEPLIYSLTGAAAPAVSVEESFVEESSADTQFKWGIGLDEYIAEYSVTNYEIQSLSDTISILHETISEKEFEDSIFVYDQYVGGIYDCWRADKATVDSLVMSLESQLGYSEAGGEKFIFNIMEIIAPGTYSSPDDFTDCVYVRTKDGIYGFVCSYTPGSYVLMIMNTQLLRSLIDSTAAPALDFSESESIQTDGASIGGGFSYDNTATNNTGSAPVEEAPADNGGFSIGGSFSSDNTATGNTGSAPVEEAPADNGGFSIGGGFSYDNTATNNTGSAPTEEAPADNGGFSIGGGLSSDSAPTDDGNSSESGGFSIGGGF